MWMLKSPVFARVAKVGAARAYGCLRGALLGHRILLPGQRAGLEQVWLGAQLAPAAIQAAAGCRSALGCTLRVPPRRAGRGVPGPRSGPSPEPTELLPFRQLVNPISQLRSGEWVSIPGGANTAAGSGAMRHLRYRPAFRLCDPLVCSCIIRDATLVSAARRRGSGGTAETLCPSLG